jgi:hypothetical protein
MVMSRMPAAWLHLSRGTRACLALLAALSWTGAAATPAAAQGETTLERARDEVGELRYDDALATLAEALRAGTNGPAQTAQIYLLLGEVRASLGQDDDAARAFQLALAIDPSLEMRKGVSPKISRPFRKARRARRGVGPLALAHRILVQDPPTIAVLVQSDPLGMVVGARIVYWTGGAGPSRTVTGKSGKDGARDRRDRIDLALPRGASRIAIAGIDEFGNRLVELGSQDRPLTLDIDSGGNRPAGASEAEGLAPAPAPVIEEEDRGSGRTPFYASWILWGGVAVAAGAAGTWAGLSANSAVDELDEIRASEFEFEYSEAKRVADRAEQRSLIANICFAAAGASAIASAVFFFRARRDRREEGSAALTPILDGDHFGVAARLRF